jgi:hypothetical protein
MCDSDRCRAERNHNRNRVLQAQVPDERRKRTGGPDAAREALRVSHDLTERRRSRKHK